jgi:CBS domain-containing protein
MDFTSPFQFMTTKLWTIAPHEPISRVKEMFDKHQIHHIPVVKKNPCWYDQQVGYARYAG